MVRSHLRARCPRGGGSRTPQYRALDPAARYGSVRYREWQGRRCRRGRSRAPINDDGDARLRFGVGTFCSRFDYGVSYRTNIWYKDRESRIDKALILRSILLGWDNPPLGTISLKNFILQYLKFVRHSALTIAGWAWPRVAATGHGSLRKSPISFAGPSSAPPEAAPPASRTEWCSWLPVARA